MPTALSELTTLRLGGPASRLEVASSQQELIKAVAAADAAAEPVLLVGGGSNLVVGDDGWPGLALRVANRGITRTEDGITASAGESWDELVQATMADGLVGLETMSGIPGLVGATPVQNVGAYGSDVAEHLSRLSVYDRLSGLVEVWSAEQCRFGFRTSAFKHTDRWIVLDVTFRLARTRLSRPIRYLELASRLGIEPGQRAAPEAVRAEVLGLRRSKGMVLDSIDHDTWSVGSFFVNPLLDEVPAAAADCPNWRAGGRTKLSAAWLIERAGFHRGYHLGPGTVAVSNKHALALTHRGGGSTAELMTLAGVIRDGVVDKFGIELGPEAHLRGCSF